MEFTDGGRRKNDRTNHKYVNPKNTNPNRKKGDCALIKEKGKR